jgi:heam-based aerotactic trancducer
MNARNQAASSQELAAFVKMMEKLADDLESLQHEYDVQKHDVLEGNVSEKVSV